MRQIVLDTETTGIGPEQGHRVIEIGCIELIDRRLTKNHFHVYLNPERRVDAGAFRVHGISDEFLQDKPRFEEVVSDFIEFIDGSELIIHNAPFDVGFLNAELKHVKWKGKIEKYCPIFDTLTYARKKHPGQRNSLDALCKRYDVNNTNRDLHGALLDAEILAWVYLNMTGGQASLLLDVDQEQSYKPMDHGDADHQIIDLPVIKASREELEHHQTFVSDWLKKE